METLKGNPENGDVILLKAVVLAPGYLPAHAADDVEAELQTMHR